MARRTSDRLSQYEAARVIAERARQIDNGDPPFVELDGENDAVTIARKELRMRRIPFLIRRQTARGGVESIAVRDLVPPDEV
jgi:DNA-directed RNA polymerase subunit K/omega